MTPENIIRETSPDDAEFIIKHLDQFHVFQYDDVLFLVHKISGSSHMQSCGGNVLIAMRKFMRDVWDKSSLTELFAPIKDQKVKKAVSHFGWKPSGIVTSDGYSIFKIYKVN